MRSNMSAKEQIRELLKRVFDEGRVNAMQIFKGYAVETGMNGWHIIPFGEQPPRHIGNSVAEVSEWVEMVKEER
jgi:hypothetical protein